MRIIPAIKSLRAAVIAGTITAGPGLGVERTPRGTRVYLEDIGADVGWHGMFELVIPGDDDANATTLHQVRVLNGNDPDGDTAGVAHVNRQPFTVPVTKLDIAATGERHYVYLKFNAPIEATDTEPAVPATVEIIAATELQESTAVVVYHLLGQAWVEEESLRLSQDHIPGNAYLEWYGPCLGLLETDDD